MSAPTLYQYDKEWKLCGTMPATARPSGRGYVLIAGNATPTALGAHQVGFAQVWRAKAEWGSWPHAATAVELVTTGEDGSWFRIEDHTREMDEQGRWMEDTGTPYWLPEEGDDHRAEARYMEKLGPLPEGAVLERPEKPLDDAKDDKRREIVSAHGAVLAFLIVDTPSATPVEAALAVDDMRKDDPEGLVYVRSLADARRTELLLAVQEANTLTAVDAITVTYPV